MEAISKATGNNFPQPRTALRIRQFPSCDLLKKIGALGKVNIGSPLTKIISIIIIGLGAASLATGFGIPAGACLICAGGLLLGGSTEASVRTAAALNIPKVLNVVTYNMGADRNDYGLVCVYSGTPNTEENYRASQLKTAAFFKDLVQRNQLDVVMLQEVYDNALLLDTLVQEGFLVFRNGERTIHGRSRDDCAIVLNPKRFEVRTISHQKVLQEEAPIVIARDKQSGCTIMFATGHVPGMNLVNPVQTAQQAEIGDGYIENLIPHIDRLSTANAVDIEIFGADMNSNVEKWKHRFDLLNGAGFATHSSGEPTEVYPVQPEYVERELDHVFSRVVSSSRSWLEKLVETRRVPRLAAQPSALMKFRARDGGVPDTASDHRPVKVEFTIRRT